MKSNYSTFSHRFNKILKRKGIITEREFHEEAARVICSFRKDPLDAEMVAVELYSIFLWKFRTMDHYFLDPGVAEFCIESVKDLSGDYFKPLPFPELVPSPSPNPAWLRAIFSSHTRKGDFLLGAYAVHFPTKESLCSLIIVPGFSNVVVTHGSRVELVYLFSAVSREDVMRVKHFCVAGPQTFADEGQEKIAKLVYGLGLYCDAFPDAMVKSTDRTQFKPLEGGRRTKISAVAAVKEENRHSVSPHYRRGHFRVLSSDRFTEKKGCTVFVKGSFVKGRAYDIKDDAPPVAAAR